MRSFWCSFLLMICSMLDYTHSSHPKNIDSIQELKVPRETTSEVCQNVLKVIIDMLNENEDFYDLLSEKGTRANGWIFGTAPRKERNWCRVEGSPVVYFSWNPKVSCIELEMFNETDRKTITRYICDDKTNYLTNRKVIKTKSKLITKRSLEGKTVSAFVNVAKEWKRKPCSNPLIEVIVNQELLYSNETSEDDDTPKEKIAVRINVNTTHFANPFTSKTKKNYTFVPTEAAFSVAKQDCFDRNMRLLTIKNEDENQDIVKAMQQQEHEVYWTSGNKLANQKTWRWSDSDKIIYTSWSSGEPNNDQGNEFCIEVEKAGNWNDNICDLKHPYICETVEVPKDAQKPSVKIFVDDDLVFLNSSASGSEEGQAHTISIHIGMDGYNQSDHTTLVLFKRKDSSKDLVDESEQLRVPTDFKPDEFNGIDFVVDMIVEKGFSCPKNYYFHVSPEFTHNEAQEFCRNRSMELVSIQDEKEHLEIQKEVLKRNINHYYWTSGYLDDGTWYWTGKEKISYSNWQTGEPSNTGGHENCLEIYVPYGKEAKWNDQNCQDRNPVICETID